MKTEEIQYMKCNLFPWDISALKTGFKLKKLIFTSNNILTYPHKEETI